MTLSVCLALDLASWQRNSSRLVHSKSVADLKTDLMTPGVGKAVNKFLENRRKFDERQKINKIRDFHSTGCLLPADHGLYFDILKTVLSVHFLLLFDMLRSIS